MKPGMPPDPDNPFEILKAYKFPTLIIAAGLILAVTGFQAALRHDMEKSERALKDVSEQVYRSLDRQITRHEQFSGSISRMLGQIRNLQPDEFQDIAEVFTSTTYYTDFYLYNYNPGDGTVALNSALSHERDEAAQGSADIEDAVRKAGTFKAPYFSNPYLVGSGESASYFTAVAAPLPDRYRDNLFLVGIIDLSRFFRDSLGAQDDTMNMHIHNVNAQGRTLIYEQIEPQSQLFFSAVGDRDFSNITVFQAERVFADHSWDIRIFSPLQGMMGYMGVFPWITFIAILSVSGLLSHLVFRITTENLKIRAVVQQQTRNLQEYARWLEMSNRDLDDFAHIASHDLKEPLRGLHNFAEFLHDDYYDQLDEDGRKKLDTLKNLAKRMESLIESLLGYSRLSRAELAFKPTDLNETLSNVLGTLHVWLDDHKARIVISEPLPKVVCDPVRTGEVFRNLITNGVKYNDKPVKTIEIGYILNYEDWRDTPVFYVKDNGIGIADQHRDHIFKIFKRLHPRDAYEGGTGAGLTIVWKIIERHGGKIWCESRVNEGTTFFFTLKGNSDDTAR